MCAIHAVNYKLKAQHAHVNIPRLEFSRDGLVRILNMKKLSKGAEIGVSNVEFTEKLLQNWIHCEKYILVDNWSKTPKRLSSSKTNVSVISLNSLPAATSIDIIKSSLKEFQHKTVFISNTSLIDVATTIADKSLDFIYIDAYNNYCEVSKRISAWWPKLTIGGIMAGSLLSLTLIP